MGWAERRRRRKTYNLQNCFVTACDNTTQVVRIKKVSRSNPGRCPENKINSSGKKRNSFGLSGVIQYYFVTSIAIVVIIVYTE